MTTERDDFNAIPMLPRFGKTLGSASLKSGRIWRSWPIHPDFLGFRESAAVNHGGKNFDPISSSLLN